MRLAFTRGGGNLAETGAVAWQFDLRGVINIDATDADIDEVQLVAIEADALDVDVAEDGSYVEVITEPSDVQTVRDALSEAGFIVERAELAKLPKNTVALDEKAAIAALKMLDRLDELDDVSRVYSNADFPDAVLEAAAGGLAHGQRRRTSSGPGHRPRSGCDRLRRRRGAGGPSRDRGG